jgi:uncharacterized protein YndB with AHSA1/START domain
MRVSAEILIRKQPEEVFPWIAEPAKAAQWQPDVKESETLRKTPEMIGTTFMERIEENGDGLDLYGSITEFEQNERIGFRLQSKVHDFSVSYSVEAVRLKAKVAVDAEIRWKFPMNLVGLLAGKKMRAGLQRQTEMELQELKNDCESGMEKRKDPRAVAQCSAAMDRVHAELSIPARSKGPLPVSKEYSLTVNGSGTGRPVTICVIRRNTDILVFEGDDRQKGDLLPAAGWNGRIRGTRRPGHPARSSRRNSG